MDYLLNLDDIGYFLFMEEQEKDETVNSRCNEKIVPPWECRPLQKEEED